MCGWNREVWKGGDNVWMEGGTYNAEVMINVGVEETVPYCTTHHVFLCLTLLVLYYRQQKYSAVSVTLVVCFLLLTAELKRESRESKATYQSIHRIIFSTSIKSNIIRVIVASVPRDWFPRFVEEPGRKEGHENNWQTYVTFTTLLLSVVLYVMRHRVLLPLVASRK